MKKKDIQSLRDKETKELHSMLKEAREAVFSLKMDLSQNKLKNTRQIFNKRKDIARILTVIQMKELT